MQPTIFDLIAKYREIKTTNTRLYEIVSKSIDTIIQSFDEFGIDTTAVSYNGGKDSDVCAQLWRMSLFLYFEKRGILGNYENTVERSQFIVFHSDSDFEELDIHLKQTISEICVEAIHSNKSFKEGLTSIVNHFHTKAIILGVRRTDPHGADLSSQTHSTFDFPPFMRILPILDWTYGDVWEFIFSFSIPYCCLYKEGYSSIGNKKDTFKNECLLLRDGIYSHASTLEDWTMERGKRT